MSAAVVPAPGPSEAPETSRMLALKPPSKTEIAKAAAEVDAARCEEKRQRWLAEVAAFEADLEDTIAEHAGSPVAACANARLEEARATERLAALARTTLLEDLDPWNVGCALQAILDDEDEAERVHRLYEALRDRAERRAARTRAALKPLILEWCAAHPPAKGKTWKFPSTEAKVVSKRHDGKLEVENGDAAVKAIEGALGTAAYEVLRVRTEVLVGEARKALEAAQIDPATLKGFVWTPAGERMEFHRARSGGDDAR